MGTDFEFPPVSSSSNRFMMERRKFVVCPLFSSSISRILFLHSGLPSRDRKGAS
jgi:hypothetical protein